MIINWNDFKYERILYRIFVTFQLIRTKYWYKLFLKKCGSNCLVMNPLYISYSALELEDNVMIRNNCRIEAVRRYNEISYNPRIIFHKNVSIEQSLHLTSAKFIEIGSNTSISANVTITDINHPYIDISIPIEQQDITVDSVYIGDDCKIYNNAVILPGTKIGKHCVVGANSVLSGEYPDYCIIVGAPAKIVKRYSFSTNEWINTSKKDVTT